MRPRSSLGARRSVQVCSLDRGKEQAGRTEGRTFWKETAVAVGQMLAQEPAVTKLIVPFD